MLAPATTSSIAQTLTHTRSVHNLFATEKNCMHWTYTIGFASSAVKWKIRRNVPIQFIVHFFTLFYATIEQIRIFSLFFLVSNKDERLHTFYTEKKRKYQKLIEWKWIKENIFEKKNEQWIKQGQMEQSKENQYALIIATAKGMMNQRRTHFTECIVDSELQMQKISK